MPFAARIQLFSEDVLTKALPQKIAGVGLEDVSRAPLQGRAVHARWQAEVSDLFF